MPSALSRREQHARFLREALAQVGHERIEVRPPPNLHVRRCKKAHTGASEDERACNNAAPEREFLLNVYVNSPSIGLKISAVGAACLR